MNIDQSKKLGAKLTGLFPTVTSEQCRAAIHEFLAFSFEAVDRAIEAHHKAHDFVNFPQLYEGCRAAHQASSMEPRTLPNQSFADVIRGQDAQLRPVKSDLEVILRSYRKQVYAGGGRCRDMLRRQCVSSLIVGVWINGFAFNPKSAAEWAETIFSEPDHFRYVLDQIRNKTATAPSPADEEANWRKSVEGIRDHFMSAWQAVVDSGADERGKQGMRATIFASARNTLLAVEINGQRIAETDADDIARAIVGVESGRRITLEGIWRTIKSVAVSSFDAIADLARHENAANSIAL